MFVQNKKIIDLDESKKTSPLVKVLIFGAIVCLPLIVIMIFFSPLARKDASLIRLEQYVLEFPVEKPALNEFVERMKKDPEFSFYFLVMDAERLDLAVEEAYNKLRANNTKDSLFETLNQAHRRAEAAAALFHSLEFSPDFTQNPDNYPEHQRVMMRFITQEFECALLGLVYKAKFQQDFIFQWGNTSIQAAEKFRDIVMEIDK